jgi:hypothetical protein
MVRKEVIEVTIDATDLHYLRINRQLRELINAIVEKIIINTRRTVDEYQIGNEVGIPEMNTEDFSALNHLGKEFSCYTNFDAEGIFRERFTKLDPKYLRLYDQFYTY